MNDFISWIKFITVMAMISVSLVLAFNVCGVVWGFVLFCFNCNASLVFDLIISR